MHPRVKRRRPATRARFAQLRESLAAAH